MVKTSLINFFVAFILNSNRKEVSRLKKYVFIDLENVHESGLDGYKELEENDVVKIFVGPTANKIDLRIFAWLQNNKNQISIIDTIGGGHNNMDFFITAELGYLLGNSKNKDVESLIITNDSGFDNIIDFYTDKGFNIKRESTILKALNNTTNKKTQASAKKDNNNSQQKDSKNSQKKENINNLQKETKKETKQEEETKKFINNIPSELNVNRKDMVLILDLISKSKNKSEFHNEIRKHFESDNYINIYRCFKKIFENKEENESISL